MPLRLQVGLQQKVGLPNYGSLGASCQVELELDNQLLERNLETFQREVEQAFAACRQAVQTELARPKPAAQNGQTTNGHIANGQSSERSSHDLSVRWATPSQIRALRAIAGRRQFDLTAHLQQRFGIARPEDLELHQASRLIDEWNRPAYGSRV